jgi:UDP-N-acetylglucosamine---dolichyl-phosphate N-acetylglucosaminyltransferase
MIKTVIFNILMHINNKLIHICIPVYNEGNVITSVLAEVQNGGYKDIIVTDDGSTDNTLQELEKAKGVVILKHSINRGKGAAIKTAIEFSKARNADIVVTMDGDGQHNPEDIAKMLKLIDEGCSVVLGVRLNNHKGMPFHKIIANYLGNFFTYLLYGLWVADSQSGFRAYSKKALNLIDTKTDRYEYDSEVIREIYRHKLKYAEIPIEVRYTEYSMNKKNKMNFKNGIKILLKMLISS